MRNVTESNDSISSKGEHFRVMMDVFIAWQMTLTTDGDYTSYFLLLFNLCSSLTGSKQKQL